MQAEIQFNTEVHNPVMNNTWRISDYITLAIFNAVMLMIILVTGMVAHPIAYLIGGGVTALLNGPIYMVMSNKINKRGILFVSSLLTGVFFLAFGFLYFMIILVIVGILCELIMWGNGTYSHPIRNTLGYILFYVGYTLCGVVPLLFFRAEYTQMLEQTYSAAELTSMNSVYGDPSMVLIMCAVTVVGAMGGCYIGNKLLSKHVKKARLI